MAGLVALGALTALPSARADTAGCGERGLPDRLCASLEALSVVGGVPTDPGRLEAWEHGWVARALRFQTGLDDHEPIVNSLWPHTHNSFNSTAYDRNISNLDPNQFWSVLDQLRMGIRAIELDLHPSADGARVVLCHGQPVPAGPATVHAGCTPGADRPLSAGLDELRTFLGLPGNEDEVVLLYLENNLDGSEALHDAVAAALDASLGDLVARPPVDQPCAAMPVDRTRAGLRAEGHRVLIVGNCGPGGWGTWVHERGPRWDERSLGDGYDAYPACVSGERARLDYDTTFVRVYEDATWLSAMADGRYNRETPEDVRAMVRCGVDLVGFDRIDPDDGRLEALVWSWAPDEPVADPARACVAWGGPDDARFRAAGCGEPRGYACRTPAGAWVVPEVVGSAAGAAAACASAGAVPSTPPTGWEDERLRDAAAAAGAGELWLSIPNPAL
jgi:hypothetical protein